MSDQTPKRIQRKRTKGWTMPENTVYVGRPTRWGNPFVIDREKLLVTSPGGGVVISCDSEAEMLQCAASEYRASVALAMRREVVAELRGKDLACWCPLDQPCHADVLLELANPSRICSSEAPMSEQTERHPRLCISKKRQDEVYAAIHEGLMQTRIALQKRPDVTIGIDYEVAQAEHLIWRLVRGALEPRRPR